MDFLASLWDILVVFFWAFVFLAALTGVVAVVVDLMRDRELKGWWKALWILFLVFFPLLGVLVYLIARGEGMTKRATVEQKAAQEVTEDYIRSVAGSSSISEIERAQRLLESGAITADEFATLKARALAAA